MNLTSVIFSSFKDIPFCSISLLPSLLVFKIFLSTKTSNSSFEKSSATNSILGALSKLFPLPNRAYVASLAFVASSSPWIIFVTS